MLFRSFKSKEECLEKIKFYLSDENELNKATEKFHLKNLEFEDSNYIIQIKKFIDSVKIKDKQFVSFVINSKKTIFLILVKKQISIADLEKLGAEFFDYFSHKNILFNDIVKLSKKLLFYQLDVSHYP